MADSGYPPSLGGSNKPNFSIPMPPPPLHTRSGNEYVDGPHTPTQMGFTSPLSTPQGSPSKNKLPPGAYDLPKVFENAMKLGPSTPTGGGRAWLRAHSPNKSGKQAVEESSEDSASHQSYNSGSPTRKSNKENTTPSTRLAKENNYPITQAAKSRQEPYQQHKETLEPVTRGRHNIQRGLTQEELEKLQLPKVKRLVNVTQLYFLDHYFDLLSYLNHRNGRETLFKSQFPPPPATPAPEYEVARSKYLGRERANLRKRRTRLRHGDFHILTQVGQGGYGKVFLAAKKDTREVCALKVMSKKLIFKLDEIRHILTERDILTAAKSDWLVKLLYAFQDEKSIYLAMEYVPGGDFRTLLNNTGVIHNRNCRFYIAEMFCCVDALHQLGFIHRDLKPENFLIDSIGHIKLTDFGLAAGMLSPQKFESMRVKLEEVGKMSIPFGNPMEQRSVAERREGYRTLRDREVNYARSVVGSPDYMAPEVLKGEEYDFTVDYWSLGCMMFEALSGYPPFAGATVDETWQNLRRWEKVLRKPHFEETGYFLSARTWDLITRLITARVKRFQNINEIYKHPYFREVNFSTLRQSPAPFVPDLEDETDAGYFDDFSNEEDMAKYKEVHDKQAMLENMADREEKMGKGLFVGFTFRHRKLAVDVNGNRTTTAGSSSSSGSTSPRKPPQSDGNFTTMI